ncbi:hypothetical protein CLIB1444_01S02652 [[Candida] jaroonii]|uniref:Uncharacterized protein n=1 Tax=[Candida] jaroonii TaxID=467808 RepID=A0ACA9Y053_9ASCO|nr:hypothetical protein CLIB1444_01S02652 [[Candida] jaroonii]
MKKYWWNHDQDIEILSSGNPIAESSPRNIYLLDDLDTQSINEDLEDSILRNAEVHNPAEMDSDSDNDGEVVSIGSIIDERGRKLQVKELTRSRSITPFKIRENISHFMGWDQETEEIGWDDKLTKAVTKNYLENISDQKLGFTKPSSRLAIMNNEQNIALIFEKEYMKRTFNDFPLYYPWAVYEKEKSLDYDTVLQTFIDFQITFKRLKRKDSKDKIRIFRSGIVPKRKDEFNIHSCSIDMKITDKLIEFETFKTLVRLIIDDTFFKPEIQISPIGLVFKKKYLYSIISIWLYPPLTRFDEENIFNPKSIMDFIECMKRSLPDHIHHVLSTAVIVENETQSITSLY